MAIMPKQDAVNKNCQSECHWASALRLMNNPGTLGAAENCGSLFWEGEAPAEPETG